MAILDHLATDDLRTLLTGLGAAGHSEAAAQALALVRGWCTREPQEADDAGDHLLRSPADGVELRSRGGRLRTMQFEVGGTGGFEPFAQLDSLLSGVTPGISRDRLRALGGPPALSAYGNETYVVDGFEVILGWAPKGGALLRVVLVAATTAERARLERKARRIDAKAAAQAATEPAPGPRVTRVDISDEDGILALIDPAAYRASVPGWDGRSLGRWFADEMAAGRGVFWATGWDAYRDYVVELRDTASTRRAFREAQQSVVVTAGRLRLVDYGRLTAAADEDAATLPDDEPDTILALPDGRYRLRIRQLVDPAGDDTAGDTGDDAAVIFEIVYALDDAAPEARPVAPLWWTAGG